MYIQQELYSMFNRIEYTINKIMEYFLKKTRIIIWRSQTALSIKTMVYKKTIQFTHRQISPATNINKYLCH